MTVSPVKVPDHEKAYQALRDMILYGELAPGQAVTIQGLVVTLEMGMTPIREAIRRLTSQGALEFKGNRRVCVPVLNLSEWDQIAFSRLSIEPELTRLSFENIDDAAIIRLISIDEDLNGAIKRGDVRGYLEWNTVFHKELYALSGARVLIAISDMLWLRGGPSLRVMLGRYGTANLPDKHAEALAAMHARDVKALVAAITEDIQQGINQIRQSFSEN